MASDESLPQAQNLFLVFASAVVASFAGYLAVASLEGIYGMKTLRLDLLQVGVRDVGSVSD
jgi:hypothetical protein